MNLDTINFMAKVETILGVIYSSTLGPMIGIPAGVITGLISLAFKTHAYVLQMKQNKIFESTPQKKTLEQKIILLQEKKEFFKMCCLVFFLGAIPCIGLLLAKNLVIKHPTRFYKIHPLQPKHTV